MIETVGLTKDFGDFRAVDNVTLSVARGAVLALLGPNGAGKTTTVRMLTSVLAPTSGRATVAGHDVVEDAARVRASVGVLTEQHGLYLRMRALEYLDFFGQVYDLPPARRRQRSVALMERFGLADSLDRRLGEFSKGMRQKLSLVRAMLHDPPVLLLDEPTSAMDPESAKLVRDALLELRRDQRAIIITTHNLNEAQLLADTIAIIRRGRIVAHGTFDELRVQMLGAPLMELRAASFLNGHAQLIADLVEVESVGEDWLRYRAPAPVEVNPQVLRRLTEAGVGVVTLSEVRQSLEDVYLRVVADGQEAA
ncbi:MAG: ABC transporter ATP-binding protein [Anaerolineae bacterium]|nr:ABC transporter ATP-binding protein [Anaerolineae bacterium]